MFGSGKDDGKNLPQELAELWEMIIAYAKQETITPLKGLGRFISFGILSSICLGVGFVLLILAALRWMQTETDGTFDANLTWAPYLITLVIAVVLAGLSARAIGSVKRRNQRKRYVS